MCDTRHFSSARWISIALACSFLVFTYAGCGGSDGSGSVNAPPGNPALATIEGVVKDTSTNHNPVVGAVITVTGTTLAATSDAQGNFVVTNVPLNATSFSVTNPNTAAYYSWVDYNSNLYYLINCTLPLPRLVAGINQPFTEIDMYINSVVNAPPAPPSVCPS
jgi:hypothetical protein